MGAVVHAVSNVAQIAIAPITAPIAAVKSIVAGDNVLAAARNAGLQTIAAMNPVAGIEGAIGSSPTGFGAVALGSTDAADRNRFLISSAVGATAGLGAAALGAAGAATAAGAAVPAAIPGAGLTAAEIAGAAGAAIPVAKRFLAGADDNGVPVPMPGSGTTDTGISSNLLLAAAGVLVLILIMKRKG